MTDANAGLKGEAVLTPARTKSPKGWGSNEVDIDDHKLSAEQGRGQLAKVLATFGVSKCAIFEIGPRNTPDCVYVRQSDQDRILIPFIVTVVLAADWYAKHMWASRSQRYFFSAVSLALMGLLPAGIWWMSGNASVSHNVALVSALLTGLLATQKTLAAWMDAHRRFGNQWRARAALRDILYSLQTKWDGYAVQESNDGAQKTLNPAFLLDIKAATLIGRAAVRLEQQQFFDTYSMPTPDVLSGLAQARPSVSSLLQAFGAAVPAPAVASGAPAAQLAAEGLAGGAAGAPAAMTGLTALPKTARFTISYDPKLGAGALTVAQGLLAVCEDDLDRMLSCISGAPALSGITVAIVGGADLGGRHTACAGVDVSFCAGPAIAPTDLPFARQAVLAELVEAAMAHSAPIWGCLTSGGEGLSRAIACELIPKAMPISMLMSTVWLRSARTDFDFQANDTDPGADQAPRPVGFATLFLNWMRWKRKIAWPQITGYRATALADIAQQAFPGQTTDQTFAAFHADIEAVRPAGRDWQPVQTPDDNPFLYPN